jgi:hypothetical protein
MKRNMNHFKLLAGAACAGMLVSGCNLDFLKPDPLSLYEPAATFSTVKGLDAAMASADKALRGYWTNTSAIDLMLPLMSEYLFSDLTVASKTDDAQAFVDINERFTPTNGWYNFDQNRLVIFWGETFNGIKYANTIISYIDRVEGLDEATKNEYLGRAYFHRAYRYLNLCFQFGDVPFVSKIIESPKQDYKSTKREAIIDRLVLDMEFAVQHVPEQKDMDYIGMINKGACRQLLIKCYLANGEFAKAKEQADILIDQSGYALMTDTFGTFSNPNPATWNITNNVIWNLHQGGNKAITANREAILVLPNRYGTDSGIRTRTMRNMAPRWNADEIKTPDNIRAVDNFAPNNANYKIDLDFNRAFGRGQAVVRPTWFAENTLWSINGQDTDMDQGDLRHSHSVGNWVRMEDLRYNRPDTQYHGENVRFSWTSESGATTVLCSDSIRSWFDWPHYKIWSESPEDSAPTANQYNGSGYADFYCYRLAETYLLRAEAKYYLGDPTAVEDVNAVRRRAGCEQLYTSVDIDDIMDERARELYMEEWRFTELSRVSYCLALSGKPDNEGKTYDASRLHEDSFWFHRITKYNNYYNKDTGATIRGRKYTMGRHNINWPIPQSAIDANRLGRLSQNPGYDGYDASVEKWSTWEEAVADEQ